MFSRLWLLLALSLLLLAVVAGPAAAQTPSVDYDADDDTLIEIDSPAKLIAIGYDLNGDGAAAAGSDATNYALGFPNVLSAQCDDPATTGATETCTGYELTANITLTAAWTPTGAYAATFEGNGHTISGLAITASSGHAGLFSELDGAGVIRNVGLISPSVTSSAAGTNASSGPLVGQANAGSVIQASYVAGGSVTVSGNYANAGGLVGYSWGNISASYTTADVVISSSPTNVFVGGFTGWTRTGAITASYSAGTVTGAAGIGSQLAGFTGHISHSGSITNSYCDRTVAFTTTVTACHGGAGSGATAPGSYSTLSAQTTAALQAPTGYEGIYAEWNFDFDGDDLLDYPWNFGAATAYPTLHTPAQGAARRPGPTDYDVNNNNLIDINNLAQLNAMRWDLDGDGDPDADGSGDPIPAAVAAYGTAFGGRTAEGTEGTVDGQRRTGIGRMGCPGGCQGYELRRDLTFPEDAAEPWHTWAPIIGPFNTTFHGNGRSLTGLKIDGLLNAGLFGTVGASGVIMKVGLVKPEVAAASRVSFFRTYAGALAGQNFGVIQASYVNGGRVSVSAVQPADVIQPAAGGLAGLNSGVIRASYSTAAVTSAGDATSASMGGLVGYSQSGTITAGYATGMVSGSSSGATSIGGLVGYSRSSTITASYATGKVEGTSTSADPADLTLGGLVGLSWGQADGIANSYCDTEATEQTACVGGRLSGSTAAAAGYDSDGLKMPTRYATIYAGWNVDVDDDARADNPWHFGGARDYPLLRVDFNGDGMAYWEEFGRQYRYIEPVPPYNPARDHPEIYANPRHAMAVSCAVRTTGTGDAAKTTSTLTFNLGRYTRPVTLTLSLWDGDVFRSLQSQGIAMPELRQNGRMATVEVVTDPAQTRFRIDSEQGLNLVLGYADCRTDDPVE